jgi:hypothetical protein
MTEEIDLAPVSLPSAGVTPSPPPEGFAWRVADFGNAMVAADKAWQFDQDISARRNALSDAIDRRNFDIERATGVTLENPWNGGYEGEARERLYKSGQPGNIWDAREQIWLEKLGALQTQYPDHADKIKADRPILDDARQLADYWSDRAAKGQPGLNAVAGLGASFLGSFQGFLRNPMNVALLPIGGGEVKAATIAGRIAEGFVREAAVNASQQALAEPAVQNWRAERGRESGVLPALEDIGMAGLFGGALGAGAQGMKSLASRAGAGERAALRDLAATPVAEREPAIRGLAQALDADEAAFADPPAGVKGLDTTVAQALDHGEGASEALPEFPASLASPSAPAQPGEADALARLAALDPGPAHDPFELAAALRDAPDLAEAARAHDAPDLAAAGRLAALGDAAFDAARNGEVSAQVALATAARVRNETEQLSIMRAAQAELGERSNLFGASQQEAAEAVSREMRGRALPEAQARILEVASPSGQEALSARPGDAISVPDAPGFDRVGQRLQEHTAKLERELIAKAPESSSASPSGPAQPGKAINIKPKRAVTREFPSLFETLASEGGLAPDPELKAIFDGNPFVPGFGRLMRKGGKTLDQALQTAKDLGYMFDAAEQGAGELKLAVNDLLDLLRREAHGDKVFNFEDQARMIERDAARAGKDFERRRAKAEKMLRADKTVDFDETWPPDQDVMAKAALILAEDDALKPAEAWKQAMEEYRREAQARYEQFDELHQGRYDETGPIPGFDQPAAAADGETASRTGGAGAGAGQEAAGAGGGTGEDRAGAGADRPASGAAEGVNYEPGAEGLPQQLIPGVAPVTDRQRAELAAAKPLRGGDAPAGGLFDEAARAQRDFFDAPTSQIAVERSDGTAEFVAREKLLAPDNGEELAGLIEQCRD